MRRIDRSEEEEVSLDLPEPRSTSVWPLVITLLVAGLGVLGWGIFAAVQPNPCQGRYTSALFSYCAEVPEGWAAAPSFESGGNLDAYQLLGTEETESGSAETTVEVAQLITAVDTQQYAQQFRTSQEADGLAVGPAEGVMLDGEQAVAWDFTVDQDPEAVLEVRDVILVRGDGAWQIRFVSTPEVYQEARIAFEQLLASWRWKG